jgi:hypothetical protein
MTSTGRNIGIGSAVFRYGGNATTRTLLPIGNTGDILQQVVILNNGKYQFYFTPLPFHLFVNKCKENIPHPK